MAGASYKPQTTVDWTSQQAYNQFRSWKREVERIINGPMHNEVDSVKLNTVFIWAGALVEQIVEAKQAEDNRVIENVPQLLQCLDDCLTHATHFREAREDFYTATQRPGEGTTCFYSRIIELHRQAVFPDNTDFLIVDKLIHGCTNVECKRKLMLKDKTVPVKTCLDILRQHEAVDVTMKRFQDVQVSATYSHDPSKRSQHRGMKHKHNKQPSNFKTQHRSDTAQSNASYKQCRWCNGSKHSRNECPARDSECLFCKKKGHFARACLLKNSRTENMIEAEYSSEDDLSLATVKSNKKVREVLAEVTFLHEQKTLTGKVDTGAMVTCMPKALIQEIGITQKIQPSRVKLRGVTGTDMGTVGEIVIEATCNNQTHEARIMVTDLGTEFLLGLDFCQQFGLVKLADTCMLRGITAQIEAVHITEESEVCYDTLRHKWRRHLPLGKQTGNPTQDLKYIFPDMFDGSVGLFEGDVDLKLAPDVKPVQLPPRAVPVSVVPKLKQELDKMEQQGIIRPCPETTDWVHNLVIANKKNGDLRICLDPKNLNKGLIRNVHYTASWEDAQNTFRHGKYFSTLDAKSGYWTQKLSPESQLLTAFNTPFKKYCFVRMPFGLSVSAEIFQAQMDKALTGVPGTFPCADDVKIQGSTEERHDIHLLETVEKASKAGIKFNPDKCSIKKAKIEYFGRIVSPQGVETCPKKVEDIRHMSPPQNKQELQSFLGSVNFMANFIPNFAQKTFVMRGLLKKDVHYVWTNDMQHEFEATQNAIAKSMLLAHFDPKLPVIIETDASLKGLGAVLTQQGNPIRFLSKSLTPTEAEYSNIERELLAILFACEKLHIYIYGRPNVVIHTDHKPLEMIFSKPISLAPRRIQRMLLRLRTYDLQIKYVGHNKVLLADTLSRLIVPGLGPEIHGLDVTIAHILKVRPSRLTTLREETRCDPVLSQLNNYIQEGWPESLQDIPSSMSPYWCFRDQLAIVDGLIMKGDRIIMPSALQAETLTRLHDGHQGISATLQRARRAVYWPGMQNDISSIIKQCEECQIDENKRPRPPTRQISASRPMEVLGLDLMNFNGQSFLVSVDYFSGYILVDQLRSETTATVTAKINENLRKFGLAERIITDNGPCFRSGKFRSFCDQLEMEHSTSSPHYHQGNGRAERSIQTIRKIMRRSKTDEGITLALLAYHDTPVTADLPSPAELFLNRRVITRLAHIQPPSLLTDEQRLNLATRRGAHLKPTNKPDANYYPQQPVWFTEDGNPEWRPGFIDVADHHPGSYWIVGENGRRVRRNKHDIKSRVPVSVMKSIPTAPPFGPPSCVPLAGPGHRDPAATDQAEQTPGPADQVLQTPGTPGDAEPTQQPDGEDSDQARQVDRPRRNHVIPSKYKDFIMA